MLNSPNSWNYISTKTDMKPGFGTIKQITNILFFKSKAKNPWLESITTIYFRIKLA